jgi:hypothetical protein
MKYITQYNIHSTFSFHSILSTLFLNCMDNTAADMKPGNNELERMWKENVTACCKVLRKYLVGRS